MSQAEETGNSENAGKIKRSIDLMALAKQSWAQSDYASAQKQLNQARLLIEGEPPADALLLLQILRSLGLLARVKVNYEESESYYLQALDLAEKFEGSDSLSSASCLNYLAGLHNARAEYGNAETLLLRSLAIYKSRLGTDSEPAALILMALAILNRRLKNFERAEFYRNEMKAVHLELDKRSADNVKLALSKLADFFYSQDRLDESDLVFRYGLLLGEENEFPQDPFVAESLLGLARLYTDYEAFEPALDFYGRAISSFEKLGAANSDSLLAAVRESAILLRRLNKVRASAELLQKYGIDDD